MKILLPVDGSDCALRAVDHLIAHDSWFREAPEIHGVIEVPHHLEVGRFHEVRVVDAMGPDRVADSD